jgi:hypothetical protein
MHIRKYLRGEQITHPLDAAHRIFEGKWLMVGEKPMHPGWCMGWSLNVMRTQVAHGRLYAADLNPNWTAKHGSNDT